MFVVLIALLFGSVKCQVDLGEYFGQCQSTEETFDECLKDGLNSLKPYFKTGLPDYGISPLDPVFAPEVAQKRRGPFFNYKLILRNVTESGWSSSQINKLKTNFNKRTMQFTQFFPDKRLFGLYEIEGTFFGNKVHNSGAWTLRLQDYVQTMTVTRKARRDANGQLEAQPPIKLQVHLDSCGKLEMHIDHLVGGRPIVENMLDRIINTAWQPGLVVLRPLINDLVATAFTEIFNKNFQNFPFEKMFPN